MTIKNSNCLLYTSKASLESPSISAIAALKAVSNSVPALAYLVAKLSIFVTDEATQIFEPQFLGILCARFKDGRNGIGKFILIGDHKQLPAVVLQSNEPVSYTHLDVYKRQALSVPLSVY